MKLLLTVILFFILSINLNSKVIIGGNTGLVSNFGEKNIDISGRLLSACLEVVIADSLLHLSVNYYHNAILIRSIPVGLFTNYEMDVEQIIISAKYYLFEKSGIFISPGIGKVISYDTGNLAGIFSIGLDYPVYDIVGFSFSASTFSYDFRSTMYNLYFGFRIKIF